MTPARGLSVASIAVVLVAAAGPFACASDDERAHQQALLARLEGAQREAWLLEDRIGRAAHDGADGRAALDRIQRLATQFHLYRHVPEIPAGDILDHDLVIYSRMFGFELEDFQAGPRNLQRRALPETIDLDGDFAYRTDDVRDIVDVTFRLPGLDEGALGRWFHALSSLGRLLAVQEIRAAPNGFIVRAEAYYFVEVNPPRLEKARLAFERLVAEPSLARDLGRYGSRRTRGLLAEIEQSYRRVNALLPAYDDSLAPLAQARLLEARFGFFAERVHALEGLALPALRR